MEAREAGKAIAEGFCLMAVQSEVVKWKSEKTLWFCDSVRIVCSSRATLPLKKGPKGVSRRVQNRSCSFFCQRDSGKDWNVLCRATTGSADEQAGSGSKGLYCFIAGDYAVLYCYPDFMGYISHRLHHQIPFLWKLHSVHHSSSKMDWLASVRVHPLNQVISRALGAIPLVLLGFSKETLGAYLIFVGLWAIFIHSNTRFELKWLHKVFATPKFHHWHHCKDMEGRDKNFAGQFPWIDLLFGTYYMPEHWPKEYGIDEPMPAGFVKQMRYPFLKENLQAPSNESEIRLEKTDQRGEDETASAGGT